MSTAIPSKLTLYTAKVCPYAARAELALAVAGVKYETFEVDLLNKPSWYAERINKASKGGWSSFFRVSLSVSSPL